MKKILICGYGNIGRHIYKEFENCKNVKLYVYDKDDERIQPEIPENFYYITTFDIPEHFDYCFLSVPTEKSAIDDSANLNAIFECIEETKDDVDTYIIRSAIPVGTSEKIYNKFDFKNHNIVVVPEYWGTTKDCPEQDFLVLGGEPEYRSRVCNLYNLIKPGNFRYIFTDNKTAELAKYLENCWLALKVTFCNEFADIAKKFGVDYNELRECWVADKRISPSHTLVYPNQPYYNSHCLNKDIPALLASCKEVGISAPLIEKVREIRDAKAKEFRN